MPYPSSTVFSGETIWIIGASSGIGRALAMELARSGAMLVLSARRGEELALLNRELGGLHRVVPFDVADADAMAQAVERIAGETTRLDRVLFLPATYSTGSLTDSKIVDMERVIAVNFTSALYLIHSVLPLLKNQGGGQIVLCASVAGYRGLPGGQPYCAMKAALINLAESLWLETDETIDVKVICPGFVRTPLTDKNDFPMPMMIEADAAARAIARGLKARAFEIHFPKRFTLLMKALRLLPHGVYLRLMRIVARRITGN